MTTNTDTEQNLWNCPRCDSRNGRLDLKCYHCGQKQPPGYAPPADEYELHRQRLALGLRMSGFSKLALKVGMVSSLVGVVLLAFRSLGSFRNGHWIDGILEGPVLALTLYAVFVTFRRILQISA